MGELSQLTGRLGSFRSVVNCSLPYYLNLSEHRTRDNNFKKAKHTRLVAGCRSRFGDIITSWLVDTEPTGVD